MDDKEIAKDILIALLNKDGIIRSEFPEAKSAVEMICESYAQILKTVKKG